MTSDRFFLTMPYLLIHIGIIVTYFILRNRRDYISTRTAQFFAFINFLILLIFVGFRYEVGGDWVGYRRIFYPYKVHVFNGATDPLFVGLMYISSLFRHAISYQVLIFLMAAFFLIPIYWYFSCTKKNPIAYCGYVSLSFPFLIPLFGLGYLRQGISSSFSLFIWESFKKKNLPLCVLYCLIATGFHKSGLIFFIFPLILIYKRISLSYKRAFLVSAGSVFSLTLLAAAIFWAKAYIDSFLISKGVLFRVSYALILVYSLYKSNFLRFLKRYPFYIVLGLILFLCANLFISTIIDRIILYGIMILFAEVALSELKTRSLLLLSSVAFLYLFGWLNFSTWATMGWIPYKSYLLEVFHW